MATSGIPYGLLKLLCLDVSHLGSPNCVFSILEPGCFCTPGVDILVPVPVLIPIFLPADSHWASKS